MKVRLPDIERALYASANGVFLLHGPDTAGSDALAARFATMLGADAERVVLAPAAVKADPALLSDEAASFSLFGGKRYILVDGGGDELLDAVANLLSAPTPGNPVLIVTGALRKGSKLLALVEAATGAMAFASYVPEGRDADRMVIDLGRAAGLVIAPALARRIAAAGAGDRAMIALELDKFALFLDASPDAPATLDADALDLLSAGSEEGDLTRVVDTVLDGELGALDRELAQLAGSGTETVALIRALARRVLLLARHRGDIDAGASVDAVMASAGKSMFYKEKPAVSRQLGRCTSDRLTTASARLLAAERDFKAPGSLGPVAIAEELFAIAQAGSAWHSSSPKSSRH